VADLTVRNTGWVGAHNSRLFSGNVLLELRTAAGGGGGNGGEGRDGAVKGCAPHLQEHPPLTCTNVDIKVLTGQGRFCNLGGGALLCNMNWQRGCNDETSVTTLSAVKHSSH
jgi:hypothetical protein